MGLSAGTRLGAYEIVAAIGAGGMGEVYRARDTKLNRDVAIKVLPELFATDPERLARFTREAQTLAALNHPNIATVYGVEHNAIAMELLDGATLREELTGPALPPRKAIDWGMQIARGLAAAHEKGIIHRDLKPENLFVTRDGRIKILDFGVARTAPPCDTVATATSLEPGGGTEPGMVVGTAGYMSPEQVRAQPVDERSDIFSLGTVLYEMLSGARPFRGDSSVETMNAILTQDPPALDEPGRAISPGLERIVRRCLEKRPADRFHSAHDVALALEATSGATTAVIAAPGGGTRWKTPAVVASILAAILLTGVATRAWLPSAQTVQPTFRRLTYQRGTIDGARFAPGSPDVIYSATWEGSGSDVFSAHPQRRQSQSLGHANANLFAVSAAQEIAMILSPRLASGVPMGTLATAPVGGGGARELAARITSADFAGATSELVYAEYTGEATRVMDPAGHVIYQASFPIRNLRCSPAGKAIAILDTSGIAVVDRSGVVTGRIETGPAVTGLAWTGDGRDVLFSEIDEVSQQTTISSARPGARPRVVWRGAGNAALQDARPDGALLVRYDDERAGVLIQQDARAATEFGSSDESLAAAISPAGDAVLINEHFLTPTGEYYTRKVDGSPPVRLGAGWALAWSPDGTHVLAGVDQVKSALTPVGVGATRELPHPDVYSVFGWFFPDGRILLNGRPNRPGAPWRFYTLDESGRTTPIGPDALDHWTGQNVLSSDGRKIAAFPSGQNQVGKPVVVPLDGGAPIPVAGFNPVEAIIEFTPDGDHLLVFDRDHLPMRIYSLDYRTGQRTLWREFMPPDPTGVRGIRSVAMTPAGRVVAYNYQRRLSTLYLVEGLR